MPIQTRHFIDDESFYHSGHDIAASIKWHFRRLALMAKSIEKAEKPISASDRHVLSSTPQGYQMREYRLFMTGAGHRDEFNRLRLPEA